VALDAPAEEVEALVDVVTSVFSGERRKPIVERTSAASSLSASASALVPDTTTHQSSAYAVCRVMPTAAATA